MISIRQILFISYAYFLRTLYFIYFMFPTFGVIENKVEVIKSYGETCRIRFKNSFADLSGIDLNFNIQPMFYDKKQLQMSLVERDNDLEKIWRTRILFEYTPRGNVVMYYDPYKLGFAYHCDQHVPYDILNMVAMKYVITFKCLDFFTDEVERPENNPSKILKITAEEEKKPVLNKERAGPFAKLKTYNTLSAKVDQAPTKDKQRNCFIHLGKIVNFQFLQKSKARNVNNGFRTEIIDGLSKNSDVQKEVFSYRDFKAIKLNTN